jgi:peptidoglycan-N-acetylglucosamine deacetylase
VPGHSLTTFTDDTDAILAGGHKLACHGWFHEDFTELTGDQQRDVLGRSVDAVRAATGAAPAGFRAPYWSLGADTLELVEAAGFGYDSSLMANDYELYVPRGLQAIGGDASFLANSRATCEWNGSANDASLSDQKRA